MPVICGSDFPYHSSVHVQFPANIAGTTDGRLLIPPSCPSRSSVQSSFSHPRSPRNPRFPFPICGFCVLCGSDFPYHSSAHVQFPANIAGTTDGRLLIPPSCPSRSSVQSSFSHPRSPRNPRFPFPICGFCVLCGSDFPYHSSAHVQFPANIAGTTDGRLLIPPSCPSFSSVQSAVLSPVTPMAGIVMCMTDYFPTGPEPLRGIVT